MVYKPVFVGLIKRLTYGFNNDLKIHTNLVHCIKDHLTSYLISFRMNMMYFQLHQVTSI